MNFRRFRPLRQDQVTRDEHSEVSLSANDFIMPYFVVEGEGIRKEIPSLKDVYHLSVDELCHDVRELLALDITKVLLFGSIDPKLNDETGSHSHHEDTIVAQAVKTLKSCFPN